MNFELCKVIYTIITIDGFKYFIKCKIFEICNNAKNVKGLMLNIILFWTKNHKTDYIINQNL